MRRFDAVFAFAASFLVAASCYGDPGGSGLIRTTRSSMHRPPIQLLEQTVQSFFIPPSNCQIEVQARSAAEALQGRFSSLKLSAVDCTVKGMRIETAAISIADFTVDMPLLRSSGKIKVFSAAELGYRLAVSESSINWLLSSNKKLSREGPPRLELGQGDVVLQGHLRTDIFNSPFRLKGKLAPRRGKEVHFVPNSVSIGWLTLPGFLMDAVAGRLNPVATIEKLTELERCNLRVRDVVVTPGLVTVSG